MSSINRIDNSALRNLTASVKTPMQIDPEIIEGCLRNERRSQNELYKQSYSMLMGICLRYEKNKEDAEVLLNSSFFKILTKIDKYQRDIPFEAWAKRVTINTIIDEFRKRKNDKHQFVETFDHSMPIESMDFNEADQRFDAEDLENMIRNLPPMSQKVFNLYIVDGYNHKEIGEMLNISEGTSKWHLSSARKTMKEMLKKVMNKVATVFL